jgi:sugar-specific transcriptional regulator TrmB
LNDRCEGDFDGEERSDPVSNATLLSLSKEVERLTIKLKQGVDNLPFAIKAEMSQILSELGKHVRSAERSNVKSHLEVELRHADDHFKDSPFLVYRFREKMEAKISLSKLTKFLAKDKPVLVLALDHNNCYVARASVPKANVGDYFDAYKWLDHATNGVNIIVKVRPPRGQDPKLVVNMSPVNFPEDSHVSKILDAAQSFAQGKII